MVWRHYKPIVLLLNITIASIAFIQFYRAGYFKWSLCWPFLITSIPFAYFGSQLPVQDNYYNLFLGLALILPTIRLFGYFPSEKRDLKKLSLFLALIIGALLGFFAGMLNIGGGIFLSPLLMLLGWANAKQTAAVSALFIVVNSLSGLVGSLNKDFLFTESSVSWFAAVLAGGLIGAYIGSHRFKQTTIQYVLACVLCFACIKLIFLT